MATVTSSDYNIQLDAVQRGIDIFLRVGNTAADAKIIGLIDSMNATKSIQTQRSAVCGSLMPVSIDPQGISVQGSVSGFLPTKKALDAGIGGLNGSGGDTNAGHIGQFNPNQRKIIENGALQKWAYVDFYDQKHDEIICWVKSAIASSFQITVQGGAYVKCNFNFEAIDMSSADDIYK